MSYRKKRSVIYYLRDYCFGDNGGVLVTTIVTLFFFTTLITIAFVFFSRMTYPINDLKLCLHTEREIKDIELEIIKHINSDPFPNANSIFDPVWVLDGAVRGDFRINLYDESSKINLNYVDSGLLFDTALKLNALEGILKSDFESFRKELGLVVDPNKYATIFSIDFLKSSVSLITPASLSNSDIDMVSMAYAYRRGLTLDQVSSFKEMLKQRRKQVNVFTSADEDLVLGPERKLFEQVIIGNVSYNVNNISEDLLLAILELPWPSKYKIQNPRAKVKQILNSRMVGEIDEFQLQQLLQLPKESPILAYLGVKTLLLHAKISSTLINVYYDRYFLLKNLEIQ